MRIHFFVLAITAVLLIGAKHSAIASEQSESARIKSVQQKAVQILHENIRSELRNKDFCMACASNLADEYVNRPNGHIKKLIDDALDGDQKALRELQELPSSTPLTPQTDSGHTFGSKVAGGIKQAQPCVPLLLGYFR